MQTEAVANEAAGAGEARAAVSVLVAEAPGAVEAQSEGLRASVADVIAGPPQMVSRPSAAADEDCQLHAGTKFV